MNTRSLILSAATLYILPLLILFSLFLLLRGHNEPGGGFVGGLVAAAAFQLHALAFNTYRTRQLLRVEPRTLIGAGLLLALASGIPGWLQGNQFMTAIWGERSWPVLGKLGTPLFFDIGVYLAVLGVVLMIMFTLAED